MAEADAALENETKWEYKTLSRKTEEYLIDDLNVVGEEGWELVSIDYHRDPTGMGENMCWTAFLKRSYTGQRRVELKQQQVEMDELEKKKKFATAQLDDSEPEFHFQEELTPRPQPYDAPATTGSAEPSPTLDDGGELKLEGDGEELRLEPEGDDGGLKLEGDEGGLKLEDDDAQPLQLEDGTDDVDVIEAEEIIDEEEETPKD